MDPPGDAETNPPGDVETNLPEDAETDPPEQTDTPGQSDPAEQEDLPGVDTPGQSDSAEQEDLTGVDPPTEADPPGETISIRPNPSGEVDAPEEANPLEEAIDEVLQAAVDTAILAARPSDNRRGSGGECGGGECGGGGCGGGCGGGGCGGGPSEIGEEERTPRRPRTETLGVDTRKALDEMTAVLTSSVSRSLSPPPLALDAPTASDAPVSPQATVTGDAPLNTPGSEATQPGRPATRQGGRQRERRRRRRWDEGEPSCSAHDLLSPPLATSDSRPAPVSRPPAASGSRRCPRPQDITSSRPQREGRNETERTAPVSSGRRARDCPRPPLVAPVSRPPGTSGSQQRPRHWLTLAYEEVSDSTRKELDDYVRQSLQALGENTDWARFEDLVGTLVGRVATMCEENMDAQPNSRPVNPSQSWRWRQQQQRRRQPKARGDRRPETSGGSGTAAERERQRQGERHPSGHHGSRHRRRNAARPRFDGPEVQRIQRLFRRNRKRCVRGILEGENSGQCTIPAGDVEAFFRNESSRAEVDVDNQPEWLNDCLRAPLLNVEWEERPISPGEVKAQMKRLPSSSAPGPDRLPYKVWKAFDPEGVILARIFEVCRQRKKVPSAWKTSTTILIHKSVDKEEPRNWRPISLQNAIYKLYVAIWGRRLAGWASEAGAVSPAQKGFVPGRGVLSTPSWCDP